MDKGVILYHKKSRKRWLISGARQITNKNLFCAFPEIDFVDASICVFTKNRIFGCFHFTFKVILRICVIPIGRFVCFHLYDS